VLELNMGELVHEIGTLPSKCVRWVYDNPVC
jgi:hypothetical protein